MKLKNYKTILILVLLLLPIIFLVQFTEPVLAISAQAGLDAAAGKAGFATGSQTNVSLVIARFINILLTFLGTLFTFFIIIAGFRWMTSGGNTEQVMSAKNTIKNASLGLLIVFVSYALTTFIIHSLMVSTGLAPTQDQLNIIQRFRIN